MTGQAHWISLVPILLGAAGIAILLLLDSAGERTFHVEERTLFCPIRRRDVRATIARDVHSLRVLGVRRCAGSPDPDLVTCDKPCIGSCQANTGLPAVHAVAH
ncbi:MAG: hypothetical protein ACJ79D_07745 [Myxococcales bacterium]